MAAIDESKSLALDKKFEHNALLDKPMNKVFDWAKTDDPVRIALWNNFMENDDHDTMKTADKMLPFLKMSDDDVKTKAESLLKK
ncbi:hypothetical protein [Acetilactobacillus jinshanensis]|uniref:Uncharacterized protein n=1 Tax=Acetilactobacillus jinshanensis TaxID=1720083 RepID=A0A4V1ALI8_9LACO|nr:hypothetical protein [Acetilactobacillus jinshanensis]QBP17749.1 hypothetical protein ELX58_00850 [Acetilactobacillus jinshanensis]